jgi:hypothetical protein
MSNAFTDMTDTQMYNFIINSASVENGNPAICSAAVELKRRVELKKSSQGTLEYCREMQSAGHDSIENRNQISSLEAILRDLAKME